MTAHLYDVKKGKHDSILKFVKERYSEHQTRMVDLYREWALTLAWSRGYQNTDFNTKTRRWTRYEFKPWEVRLVTNLMLPLVRSRVAKTAIPQPIWDVVPATPDQEDIEIARTSSKILQDQWYRLSMTQKLILTTFWTATTGNSFLKIGWDVDAGRDVQVSPEGLDPNLLRQFLQAAGIEAEPETLTVKSGSTFCDLVSPFNITVDPLVTFFNDAEWCFESSIWSLDKIVDMFGTKWKDKLTEQQRVEATVQPFVYTDDNEKVDRKGVLVHELYIKKSPTFKKGLHAVIAEDNFLIPPKDLPYNHGELPYVHFTEIPDPLSMWGTSVAQQARGVQARYNRINASIIEHVHLMGKKQWKVPYSSGVKSISNKPGDLIFYKGNMAPEQTDVKPLPAYIENALERARRDMQDVTSHHNVSQAQTEPGLRSGRAIIALQDADDAVDAATFMWFDEALKRVGRLLIQTINQYATEADIVKVRGEFNELETLTYTGSMLRGSNDADYFDVRLKVYNRKLNSRSGREEEVARFIELGILDPVRDRTTILHMIGSADVETILDEEGVERSRQWAEIKAIRNSGTRVPVAMGEKHHIHKEMIQKFMSSSLRDKTDPNIVALIQNHYQDHVRMEATEFAIQQALVASVLQGPGNVAQNKSAARPGSGGGAPGGSRNGNAEPNDQRIRSSDRR